jgi:sugar phosphate isomerase/epimerase
MTNQITLGLVTDVVPIEEIAEGWDFYEIPNSVHILPLHSESTWAANRDRYRDRGVITPVASHYVSGANPRFGLGSYASGPSYDREQQLFWAARSFRRMHEIGVKVVGVWGGFFQCPDGYPTARAWDDAVSFCNILADEGDKYGIQIALEPNAKPDTLFPSYTEGLKFAKTVHRESIKMMVDLNYFLRLGESFDIVRAEPEYCLHVQMAGNGNGHSQTNIEPHTQAYDELFQLLKDIEYNGTVSVASPWLSSTGSDPIDYAYETSITLKYMQNLRDKHFG